MAAPLGRVSQPVFMAMQWIFTATSFLFLLFRLTVRFTTSRHFQFHLDDFLVLLAWSFHLATSIIWQVKSGTMYLLFDVINGKAAWTPDLADRFTSLFHYRGAINILFFLGLWCIKLSFLVFFYGLGSKIKSHRIWWYVVAALTVALGALVLADGSYQCLFAEWEFIRTECINAHYTGRSSWAYYTNGAADVLTDLLILSIPSLIIWRTRIEVRKKLVLTAVFSATVFVIAVAIARVTTGNPVHQFDRFSWGYLWCSVEGGTAIIIACTAAFRQLFICSHNQHLYGGLASPAPTSGPAAMRCALRWPKPNPACGWGRRPGRLCGSRGRRVAGPGLGAGSPKADGNRLDESSDRSLGLGPVVGVEMGEGVREREEV
ncbi:uncharacterized protein DSM5745_05827 [Aspergillus mulundensis]|uniref:Rhodopsin domain-containing protein n=1 Tax=Aspergillus mulundensis TaxID=1810919 RepID=A0A3D8RY66_9EURO|nr:hypothetical protein DSM5745_05827 [Aspergillus mulundensis]RDW78975.1 hypothetical protein DSM5745_05827 [Aspergillus mulundensis]